MEGRPVVAEANDFVAPGHKRWRDVVVDGVRQTHRIADADAREVKLVPHNAVVRIQDVHIEEVHPPVHISHHEMHRIVNVDDFLHWEFTTVVHAAAVWMLVGLIEPLALRHQCGIAHRDVAILVDVRAGRSCQVVAEDAFHVSHGICMLLCIVVVEVAHEGIASAFAIAIHLGCAKEHPVAVVDGLTASDVFHHQST